MATSLIAKNLARLMSNRDLRPNDIVEATRVSRGFLDKILAGRTLSPGVLDLKKLADYFDVRVDQLLETNMSLHSNPIGSIPLIRLDQLSEDILWEIADEQAAKKFPQAPDFFEPADFVLAPGNSIFPPPFSQAHYLFITFTPIKNLLGEFGIFICKLTSEKCHIYEVHQEFGNSILKMPSTGNTIKYNEDNWLYIGKLSFHIEASKPEFLP